MTEIAVTDHCVVRFRQRVRPALSFGDAERELLRLVREYGEVSATMPEWLKGAARDAKAYLLVGDQIALPLRASLDRSAVLVAVTCVHRAALSPGDRRRRDAARHRRRASKRGKRMGKRREARRSPGARHVPALDLSETG